MITLTENAASYFGKILQKKGLTERFCIRFRVEGGGCSGFTYSVSIEPPRSFELSKPQDTTHISEGIRTITDKKSLLFLKGTTIDYQKSQFGHKLVYKNPNAKGVCGCGESFAV